MVENDRWHACVRLFKRSLVDKEARNGRNAPAGPKTRETVVGRVALLPSGKEHITQTEL